MNIYIRVLLIFLGIITLVGCSSPSQYQSGKSSSNQELDKQEAVSESSTVKEKLDAIGEGSVTAQVKLITDGDTYVLTPLSSELDLPTSFTVRALNIETPEWTKEKMPYGDKATERVKELIPVGSTVTFYYDHGNKTDKYNRHLGYILTINNQLVQQVLVEEGLAMIRYVFPPGDTLINELKESEKIARTNRLNIWSTTGYVSSDGYRPEVIDGPIGNKTIIENIEDTTGQELSDTLEDSAKEMVKDAITDAVDKIFK